MVSNSSIRLIYEIFLNPTLWSQLSQEVLSRLTLFKSTHLVSKNDNTRVDLIVANDQHLYLKACDYKERQKWLVALASQKATHSSKTVPTTLSSSAPTAAELLGLSLNSDELADAYMAQQQTPFDTATMLKIKQSELRLYCDLLSQQTHELKSLVNKANNGNKSNSSSAETSEPILATKTTSVSDKIDIVSKRANDVPKAATTDSAASSFKSVSNLSINEEVPDEVSKAVTSPAPDDSKLDINVNAF